MVDETNTTAGGSTSGQPVKEELKQDTARLKDQALDRAKSEAETRKDQAAQTATAASSALERAASELRSDDQAPDWLASGIERVASSVSGFADSIQSKNVDEIGRDISRFARENPAAFLTACAAAGFAAARFLRVGAEEKGYLADHTSGTDSSPYGASASYGAGRTSGVGGATATTGSYGSTSNPASTYGSAATGGYGGSGTGGAA